MGSSPPAIADVTTMQCVDTGQAWAMLQIDSGANTVSITLANPASVGPGNYSGAGTYSAQITSDQIAWTLPFSATHYDYTLARATGALRQQVYVNDTGELVGDTATVSCS